MGPFYHCRRVGALYCGELFTVSRSVVSLLHALTTAALYPLPKSYPVYLVNHSVVSLLLSLTSF